MSIVTVFGIVYSVTVGTVFWHGDDFWHIFCNDFWQGFKFYIVVGTFFVIVLNLVRILA